jgi:CDP-glucose 4,6-dehydratase
VSASYAKTFLNPKGIALSTVRVRNVIGGGDTAKNRIIPDCVRAARRKKPIIVRPYQHVLEALFAYLLLARKQVDNHELARQYNIGPDENGFVTTGELADIFCEA